MEEEWRDAVGYEGYYKVSSLGRVKSIAERYGINRSTVGYINSGTIWNNLTGRRK